MIQRGLRRHLHLLDDYMGKEERKEMSNWSNGPEILRDFKGSTKLCPFIRHYCTAMCAMAVTHEDIPKDEWLCGLIVKGEDGVIYKTIKHQL